MVICAARSAMMIVGAFVLPLVIVGMIDASVKLIVPTALLPALASLLATPRLVGAQGCALPGNQTYN
jgi:hypothetical protein